MGSANRNSKDSETSQEDKVYNLLNSIIGKIFVFHWPFSIMIFVPKIPIQYFIHSRMLPLLGVIKKWMSTMWSASENNEENIWASNNNNNFGFCCLFSPVIYVAKVSVDNYTFSYLLTSLRIIKKAMSPMWSKSENKGKYEISPEPLIFKVFLGFVARFHQWYLWSKLLLTPALFSRMFR